MAYATDGSRGGDRSFLAKYPGPCGNCGDRIVPGELVHFEQDELCHVVCDAEIDRIADTPPCPRCFTVPSATGTCLCD